MAFLLNSIITVALFCVTTQAAVLLGKTCAAESGSACLETPPSLAKVHPNCPTTHNWPGWSGIKHAFIFGDSYTTTGFNVSGIQPTPTNPLGNPAYPGSTSSDGPNWVDYLTVEYNRSLLLTYNLAYGGATIDSSLVTPYLPIVSSVAQQIENEWFPTYASKPSFAPWSSSDSLFGIFDGINDVGKTYAKGLPASAQLNDAIFAVYEGIVDELYYMGARNFLFINVPPVSRAPVTLALSPAYQQLERDDILSWNSKLDTLAKRVAEMKGSNVWLIDSYALFTEVLDNPASYPQTAGYKNTTGYCVAYMNGTATETTFDPSCEYPVQEYFWLNSLHPTYPMQNVLAQKVAQTLEGAPNIC